jgi:hypothetical protein
MDDRLPLKDRVSLTLYRRKKSDMFSDMFDFRSTKQPTQMKLDPKDKQNQPLRRHRHTGARFSEACMGCKGSPVQIRALRLEETR